MNDLNHADANANANDHGHGYEHVRTPLLLEELDSTPVYPIIHMIKEVSIDAFF